MSLLFCSCTNRHEGYSFLSLKDNPDGLNYTFTIDTLCTYDTYISCKFNSRAVSDKLLRMRVIVTDPRGENYCDTLVLPLHSRENETSVADGILICNEGAYTDIQWPYRSGVKSDIIGKWGVTFDLLSNSEGILGMGFSYMPAKK
ncbi:MAG: hypothetical protein IJS02_00355 [Bacteroidales bacterium]|nr:hypothetical protein [Bacteroidales bacterium]